MVPSCSHYRTHRLRLTACSPETELRKVLALEEWGREQGKHSTYPLSLQSPQSFCLVDLLSQSLYPVHFRKKTRESG